jgi:hypothetical protein
MLVSCAVSRGSDARIAMARFGHRLRGFTAEGWPSEAAIGGKAQISFAGLR